VIGPRPLNGGRALLDVGKDSIDEILASPIAKVLNDERADRTDGAGSNVPTRRKQAAIALASCFLQASK
jgi:H2-forming N5,N10-methylenetetrahydromethanopterin dehydrogenase-like enzyme